MSGGPLTILYSPLAPLQVLVTENCPLELAFLVEGGERRQQEAMVLAKWTVPSLGSQA